MDFYSTSTLKQQSEDRHVAQLGTLSWFQANQSLIFLFNAACCDHLKQSGLELTIYRTRGEHVNNYTTNLITFLSVDNYFEIIHKYIRQKKKTVFPLPFLKSYRLSTIGRQNLFFPSSLHIYTEQESKLLQCLSKITITFLE